MKGGKGAKGPAKHDPVSYRLERDIVIKAGTIFRAAPEHGYVQCAIGHGKDFASRIQVKKCPEAEASGDFTKVTAA